jgi:hypothetical protein
MKNLQNENLIDRLARFLLAEVFWLVAYFWIGGVISILFYIFGAIALFTALTGFCALYKLVGFDTLKKYPQTLSNKIVYLFIAVLIIIPTAGSYYSNFFTKKFFLEDYSRMNNYYKLVLFNTGQDKRAESTDNYEKLTVEYKKFADKYSAYHPFVIKGDSKINNDISDVAQKIASAQDKIYNGDLPAVHKDLELIRPIFQDLLKRNGFSLLAVALVDFHDAMEKIITAADAKSPSGVIDVYREVDEKLKAVEATANDAEIKAIRTNLDSLLDSAKNNKPDELSKRAADLKSSFIKVYLKRG